MQVANSVPSATVPWFSEYRLSKIEGSKCWMLKLVKFESKYRLGAELAMLCTALKLVTTSYHWEGCMNGNCELKTGLESWVKFGNAFLKTSALLASSCDSWLLFGGRSADLQNSKDPLAGFSAYTKSLSPWQSKYFAISILL